MMMTLVGIYGALARTYEAQAHRSGGMTGATARVNTLDHREREERANKKSMVTYWQCLPGSYGGDKQMNPLQGKLPACLTH